jgi:excisionase family DNA binding protein
MTRSRGRGAATTSQVSSTPDATLPPALLNVEQLASLLQVNVRHIRRLVHERRVPYIKWGSLVRFDPAEIKDWLDGKREPPRQTG